MDPGQHRRGKSALEWANPPKTKLCWGDGIVQVREKGKGIEKKCLLLLLLLLLLLRVSIRDLQKLTVARCNLVPKIFITAKV